MFDLMPFEHRQRNLSNYFDNLERSFFGDFRGSMETFRTDILDKDDKYILQAELPGFAREDIHIDLNGDLLTICAEHGEKHEDRDEKGSFLRRERSYGSFSRSFDISGINAEGISADYKNGVLELDLPKSVPQNPIARKIEIH